MADIELVIKINKRAYDDLVKHSVLNYTNTSEIIERIKNGTPLPKGHGDLIDKKVVYKKFYSRCLAKVAMEVFAEIPTIIEADKEYEVKIITRGNCMMCGKELVDGLFFCKECENKANDRK